MPGVVTLDLVPTPGLDAHPARLHGAACALVEPGWDGAHTAQLKPYSVGPLVAVDGVARWRLGWLAGEVPAFAAAHVRFGPVACPVLRCDVRSVPFASLAGGPPAWAAELEFVSPLYFSRNGRDHPLPDPVLLVRSALGRWNAFAPAALAVPDAVARELVSTVWLAGFAGRADAVPITATMRQLGFVGTVRLALTRDAGPVTAETFAALMRFAEIAGFGARTTHGFGAVHLRHLDTTRPTHTRYRSTPDARETPRSSQTRSRSSPASPPPQGDPS